MSKMNESENDDSIYEEYDGIYEEYQSVNEKEGPKEAKKVKETQDQASAKRFCSRLGPRPMPVEPRPRSSFKTARIRTTPFRPAEPC